MSAGLPQPTGIGSSLLGKRARLESESHAQNEYVTDADMARRLLSNLRFPITERTPTVANEVWRLVGSELRLTSCPATRSAYSESSATGSMRSLLPHGIVSNVVRHDKGSDRSLSQTIVCYASNAGTGHSSLLKRFRFGVGGQIANARTGAARS
jgi:hypothetical protein